MLNTRAFGTTKSAFQPSDSARTEARVLIEQWRRDYNEDRPHQGLGNLKPAAYMAKRAAGEIEPRNRPVSQIASHTGASGPQRPVCCV